MMYVRISPPWIEISDSYTEDSSTYTIRLDDIVAVYDKSDSVYNYGILTRHSGWISNIDRDSLRMLKGYMMSGKV